MKIISSVEDWLGTENQLGLDIWSKKYRQNNETFMDWLHRITNGDMELRELIIKKQFLFGGRILSNRGIFKNGRKVTYSNCYVLEAPEDNLESIFETASKLARTFSYGGGCGIDISKLSPRGAAINNTAKETTGSVSFMELYSLITGLIGQNGRRGALMLSIDCNHPDLEEFISVKNDLNSITKANISVRIDKKFMNAVVNNLDHELIFKREETGEEIKKVVDAKSIFEHLCRNNWDYAEPGILFWDRIESHNLLVLDEEFSYAGVNPCAEEPLPAGGSCLLGSINLSEFVRDGVFEYENFKKAVRIAVRALNDVLDEGLPLHPLQEQRDSVGDWRQIGLGIFGLADMLIKMGLKYGDQESIFFCDDLAFVMINEAIKESAMLAKDHGPYPKYKANALKYNDFFQNNTDDETKVAVARYGLRNSQLLTVAPTGSLSTMLGVSGGIEPIFDTHYERKTESLHGEDKYYTVYTPIVDKYMKDNNIKDISELPEYFTTAKTINPIKRIDMQGAWQEHIDASISSTVNLPESSTVEDVISLYAYAWKSGLKGLTIFRENCARLGILTSMKPKDDDKLEEEVKVNLNTISPITRDELGSKLKGTTYVKHIACGKLYITINRDVNDNLVEVFIESSKSGGCSANAECLGRYASACMRSGMKIDDIIEVTKGVKCSACTQVKGSRNKNIDGISCGDVVARTINEEYLLYSGKSSDIKSETLSKTGNPCVECGEPMFNEGGCSVCKSCGYSKCD